jgi:hypothetical protein
LTSFVFLLLFFPSSCRCSHEWQKYGDYYVKGYKCSSCSLKYVYSSTSKNIDDTPYLCLRWKDKSKLLIEYLCPPILSYDLNVSDVVAEFFSGLSSCTCCFQLSFRFRFFRTTNAEGGNHTNCVGCLCPINSQPNTLLGIGSSRAKTVAFSSQVWFVVLFVSGLYYCLLRSKIEANLQKHYPQNSKNPLRKKTAKRRIRVKKKPPRGKNHLAKQSLLSLKNIHPNSIAFTITTQVIIKERFALYVSN